MEINYLIAHNINIHYDNPEYADQITYFNNLIEDEKEIFSSYFTNHIDNQRTNNRTKPAIFVSHEGEILNRTVEFINKLNISSDTNEILQTSKELTYKLHQTMKGTSRSDGIILFVHYTHNMSNFLSIMKMDPEIGMKFNKDTNVLEIIKDMLPNSSRKLHKVAFFNLNNIGNDEYKFLVLDKQQTDDTVSNFFIDKFLEAKLEYDDKKVNKIFSENEDSLIETLRENGVEDSRVLDKIYKEYKALFYKERPILITDEVKTIIESQINDGNKSEQITRLWANEITEKYSEDVYFEFNPSPVKKYDTVYTDENQKITLKYEADLDAQDAIKFEETEDDFIIYLDKSVVKTFEPKT